MILSSANFRRQTVAQNLFGPGHSPGRLAVSGLLLFVLFTPHIAFAAKHFRDWQSQPEIVELDGTFPRIAAVGDVHGNYKRLVKILTVAKIIDQASDELSECRWSAHDGVFVCTGDLIDKGDHSLKVIELFKSLQKQAAAAGGTVIVTMGNHEAEFLTDPNNDDKAEAFIKELAKAGIDSDDVAKGEDSQGIGMFLCGLPLAARVNDWFFAHACGTHGETLDALRHEIRDDVDVEGLDTNVLLGKRGLLEARLKPAPWWERDGDQPADAEARLRVNVNALGVHHFVMGHQPEKVHFVDGSKRAAGEMIQKFDGLIFLIDVGISNAIDYSNGAILQIENVNQQQQAVEIDSQGVVTPLWSHPIAEHTH